jgi:hypothetical protein
MRKGGADKEVGSVEVMSPLRRILTVLLGRGGAERREERRCKRKKVRRRGFYRWEGEWENERRDKREERFAWAREGGR